MRTTLSILALVTLSAACTPKASDYDDAVVNALCKTAERCDEDFDANFDDFDDCVSDFKDFFGDSFDCQADACDYDAKAAAKCLSSAKTMTCDDYADPDFEGEGCNDVFTNCDVAALATCGGGFDTAN